MTTLVLQTADSLIGLGARAATSLLEGAITGALGSGSRSRSVVTHEGPRLTEMSGLGSTEGAPIPRVFGRVRVGGQLIWATRFEEVVNTTTTVERQPSRGGKGFGGGARSRVSSTTTYSYFVNLAVGLCEGEIAFVRRVWADARELDLTTVTMRVHRGTGDQVPDPLLVAKEGPEQVPAYRGLAYVVFERLPLAEFGNRVPQLSFEVVRPPAGLPEAIRSVCLIPGATEFGYDTIAVSQDLGLGTSRPENVHQLGTTTDVAASLDHLQALCPYLRHVSVVVSWFGSDLRAGDCRIEPKVDLAGKSTVGAAWRVAGLTRETAAQTSRDGAHAAYGGTPSDESVVRLIGELKARGLAVTLYPFVMLDIPAGNDLPDPRTGLTGQPPYPWRGRITCDPAPGQPGSVDGTSAAAAQFASLFGSALPAYFGLGPDGVAYSGPEEWTLRRLVLHCSLLAVAAGGVDGFVIGSELVGLTRVRGPGGAYPAVAALKALAADVRTVLGPTTPLTYAADWTEYGAHVLADGAEVRFPLDPLWADPAIDAVGIDYYPPLTDWRDGPGHADKAIARCAQDPDYLHERLGAGEAFDWFYPDAASRLGQSRSPITDGAYGKPWVFRPKDLVGWWSNSHVERVGGIEVGATPWEPGGKPIWLTEVGIPAVDKGPNGPNVFPDPKSAESALPPFSDGRRDDLVQARALGAILRRFDPARPGHVASHNPVHPTTGRRMVDPARISVWCWDARPYPAFPDFSVVWGDSRNWSAGHWVTGRLEGAPLDRLVAADLDEYGLDRPANLPLDGWADGYVLDRPMSAREALEPLARLFGFDAVDGGAGVSWRGRGGRTVATLVPSDFVPGTEGALLTRTRSQETELPGGVEIDFIDGEAAYATGAVGVRRTGGGSRRALSIDAPVVSRPDEVSRLAALYLQDAWSGRETATFALSPRAVAFEPGDIVAVEGSDLPLEIVRIADGSVRQVTARAVDPDATASVIETMGLPVRVAAPPRLPGRPAILVLDLPRPRSGPEALQHLAVSADPWPGAVAVWRSADGTSWALHDVHEAPAVIGETLSPFPPGPVWRIDRGSRMDLRLARGSLASIDEPALLGGENLLAVLGPEGAAEVLGFADAELIGERIYQLGTFLRGLGGTEAEAARFLPAGARVVRLDEAVRPLASSTGDFGRTWRWRVGPADRDHADPSYAAFSATIGGRALQPRSPVHLRARRHETGVRITWLRRTRVDGDSWNLLAVPLGEEDERYEVEVLSGGEPVWSVEATTSSAHLPASTEISLFGSPQAGLTVRVAQLSRAVGRGQSRTATLHVT